MATSSVKIFIEDETAGGKSLIYKMERKGPKMEPCGTPGRTGTTAIDGDSLPPASKK